MGEKFLNLTLKDWIKKYPLIEDLIHYKKVLWENKSINKKNVGNDRITLADIQQADERLNRFAPLLMEAFPETTEGGGIIESPLLQIPHMESTLNQIYNTVPGRLYLKCDHMLPIAGSVKARGGIYEVLKLAEKVAVREGFKITDNYRVLLNNHYKAIFAKYTISVGSTGNLGLSIGIMGAKLGFQVIVHMSADAKEWKKELLRRNNVQVVEHSSDYSYAVEIGRKACQQNDQCFFIDDENSMDLFLGYSVSAIRLQKQLIQQNITIDENHPLFVYLPCGVGGAPGGIAFGLNLLLGEHVHLFFAEPTHSPCMLLGLLTNEYENVSVQDFGMDNKTDADGLAVGRPSAFVGKIVRPFIDGIYTVEDTKLYKLLYLLYKTEKMSLEPSALAGMAGPLTLMENNYFENHFTIQQMKNSTHLVWSTGGSLVPAHIMDHYIQIGETFYQQKI